MAPDTGTRVLATVLFTDIVQSTRIAEELGDRRWRELLRRHHAIVRRELRRFRGREIDTAGDGFLALFDSPAQGVRCACAVADAVRELGIEIRAGLHLGEVELTDGKAQGIAVHIGARILSLAKPGQVLVSAPLRTTVAGSDLEFEARGRRRLKGVEGTWQLFAVAAVDGSLREPPLEEGEGESRRAAIVPVPAARRPAIAALGVLVVLAIVAAVLVSRGGPPAAPRKAGLPVGSLVRIDPDTDRVEQVIESVFYTSVAQGFAVAPQIASGEGSVWVLAGPRVNAIDPNRGEAWGTTRLPDYAFGDQGFEVGYRTVWVFVGDTVYRINPATGDLLQSTTHSDWPEFGGDLATGSGAVWVGIRGSIFRLDPPTGRLIGRVDFPGSADQLAIGDGSLWALDALGGSVFRIEPRENGAVKAIPLAGNDIAVGEGAVWILDTSVGTLTAVRPDTGEPRSPIEVGDDPTGLAVGLGAVWVAGGEEEIVTRVNPNTGATQDIRVGGPVSDIAIDGDEDAVWVTIS